MVTISDEQAEQIARTIIFDIKSYINSNREAYEKWLKEEYPKWQKKVKHEKNKNSY